MPCKSERSVWSSPLPALCCAERCALIETCGETACFQLDWLDDLHRSALPRHVAPTQARPRKTDREDM
ncbi:hypothetical protein [Antarcticimicrobium luteum]|uniref:Uncharacterized protein n=1 Tax=Antarcticimicrobium luteum TaxID=2547397 RepID=A0A4R5VGC0_9RHOB|nr:hypothetical protein [Antarcticimicrobium luteum]TDK51574.1 hypothetical protein E1832_02940 [Antarcticimicrobium luteum]